MSSPKTKDNRSAPSQHIPNFVGQYYETSTFHHLSTWRLQYQRLVAQLNRAKGPEFQPDASFETSSNSDQSDPVTGRSHIQSSSSSSLGSSSAKISALTKPQTRPNSSMDLSSDSSSLPSEDVAPSTSLQGGGPVYIHLDMDAFYANVLINRRFPHLKDFPVVVVPAKNTNNGTSEVASANYVARDRGIRARMFVSEARKLCPQLQVITCDYSLFEDTSARMYEQILRYTHSVEAVSADEAYLDITPWGFQRALNLAQRLQNDVSLATHCPCSIGVGSSKLVARLSTFKAKPAGIVITEPSQAAEFVKSFEVSQLPGVGPGITSKLVERNIKLVSDLCNISKQTLQLWFGEKTGTKLFEFSRGIDTRPLKTEQDRKSVGTQISWGVRMLNQDQVNAFLTDLTAEVCKRMADIEMIGSRVTLRVLKKRDLEEEPDTKHGVVDAKMGGCNEELTKAVPKGESAKAFNPGNCTQLSRSGKLPFASGNVKVLAKEILRLYKLIGLQPTDLRGAGISVDDLESASKQAKNATIHSFFKTSTNLVADDASSAPKPVFEELQTETSILQPPAPTISPGKRSYSELLSQNPSTPASVSAIDPPLPPPPPAKKISSSPPKKSVKKQANILAMFGIKPEKKG